MSFRQIHFVTFATLLKFKTITNNISINFKNMKRTNTLVIILTMMLLPGFVLTSYAQKSIQLKYNLKKGDKYASSMKMDQDIDMNVQDQSMTISQNMNFDFSYFVKDVKADSFDLSTTIDAISMKQTVMGMEIVYDSKDTSTYNNPVVGTKVSAEMNKLIGVAITSTMSKNGNVGSVDLGSIATNQVAGNIKSSFSQAVYPDHKIKVGESWTNDITTKGLAEMNMHMTYTLNKITRKQAEIGVKGTIDSPDASAKLKGTITGNMTVNRKTGWVIHSTFDQDFNMQMKQNGMSFPASISGSYEINSKKEK